ncbi:MAG TPA: hypothetical protein VGN20_08295 [Mucilaginibacter sp.]|jgi:hypothetical protein
MTSTNPDDENPQNEISDEQSQLDPQMSEEANMTMSANSLVGLPTVPDPKR